MKFAIGVFAAVFSLALAAQADVPALTKDKDTTAFNIADEANNILSVQYLKLDNYAYKIVGLDTALNGEFSATTIVLVGENEVGSAAGYENSFLLTPVGDFTSISSVQVKAGFLQVTFTTNEFKKVVKKFKYDPKTGVLKSY